MVTHPETSIDPPFLMPPYAKSLANKKNCFYTSYSFSSFPLRVWTCKMHSFYAKWKPYPLSSAYGMVLFPAVRTTEQNVGYIGKYLLRTLLDRKGLSGLPVPCPPPA